MPTHLRGRMDVDEDFGDEDSTGAVDTSNDDNNNNNNSNSNTQDGPVSVDSDLESEESRMLEGEDHPSSLGLQESRFSIDSSAGVPAPTDAAKPRSGAFSSSSSSSSSSAGNTGANAKGGGTAGGGGRSSMTAVSQVH